MKMLVSDIAKLKSDGSLDWILPIFEYSNRYPFAPEKNLDQLSKDIQLNGLKDPLWIWVTEEGDKMFLDGRNRLKAILRITGHPEVEVLEFHGSELEAAEFVVSANIHRRDLDASQKAFMALDFLPYEEEKAKLRMLAGVSMSGGDPLPKLEEGLHKAPRSVDLVGERFSVSSGYVSYAKKINENIGGIEEAEGLKARVMLANGEPGKMSLQEAYSFLLKVIEDYQRLAASRALEAERKAAEAVGNDEEGFEEDFVEVERPRGVEVSNPDTPSETTTPSTPRPAKLKKSDAVLRAEHWKEVSTSQMKVFNEKITSITSVDDIETIWSLLENIRHHADISFAALECQRDKLEENTEYDDEYGDDGYDHYSDNEVV